MAATSSVLSSIYFVKRDPLFDKEKPYEYSIPPPENVPKTNIRNEKIDGISIQDIRGRTHEYSFGANGFEILSLDAGMSIDEYDQEQVLVEKYFPKLAHAVKEKLNASQVQIFNYNVSRLRRRYPGLQSHQLRKRHPQFPISTGEAYAYAQPASLAHLGL